jgi:lysophospholipase L1-like esterase
MALRPALKKGSCPMSEFVFQDGQTIVFIGDSITDCGRRGGSEPFGTGYVKAAIDLITARYPELDLRHFNEGISGNTVQDLCGRWQSDVVAHRPDWVSVKIGINDLHRTLDRTPQAVPPDGFERLYRECLEITRAATSARLVLLDPFYISSEPLAGSREADVLLLLPAYLDAVCRLAAEYDALHVRTHAAFQEQLKYRPAAAFCPEPVHPFPSGHLIIAHELLRALGW